MRVAVLLKAATTTAVLVRRRVLTLHSTGGDEPPTEADCEKARTLDGDASVVEAVVTVW
jgi:hypothetical protein